MEGAELARADLRGAKLEGAELARANLRGANLDKTNFSGAILVEADLSEAELRLYNSLCKWSEPEQVTMR